MRATHTTAEPLAPPPSSRRSRQRPTHQLVLMLFLAALLASALAACAAAPTTSTTQQASTLHLILDGHFASQSVNSLRSTLVALDAHTGHVAWKHPLETPSADDGSYSRFPAVLVNGTIYLGYYYSPPTTGLHYSVLEALDAATGATRWRQEIDAGHQSEIAGPPVLDGATVYIAAGGSDVAGQQGLVAAYDAQSGGLRWRTPLAGSPSMPAVANGDVLLLTSSTQNLTGHLLALRASDGSMAWDYTSSVPLLRGSDAENGDSTAPVVAGGFAFPQATQRHPNGTADVVQLAIDLRDGSLAWQYETGGLASTPAFNQRGDTLCLGISIYASQSWTSQSLALSTTAGQQRWNVPMPNFSSGCVPSGETFLFSAGTLAGANGAILSLKAQDGTPAWQTTTGAPVDAAGALAPTVANGFVITYLPADATGNATTVVLKATDGSVVWRQSYRGHPDVTADVEGDVLYNAEQQGSAQAIVAYALATGAHLWTYTLGNA